MCIRDRIYAAIVRKEIRNKKHPYAIEDYIRRIDLGEDFHQKDFMKLFVLSTDHTLNNLEIGSKQRKMAADKLKYWVLNHPVRDRDVGRICMKYIAQHDNIHSSIVAELVEILDKLGIYYEDKEWALIVKARVGNWPLNDKRGKSVGRVIDEIIKEDKKDEITEPILETIEPEQPKEKKSLISKIKEKVVPIKPKIEEVKKEKPKEKKPTLIKKITETILTEQDISKILDELQTTMLEHDVALEVVEKISNDIKTALTGKSVTRGQSEKIITNALRKSMLEVLTYEPIDLEKKISESKEPFVIAFVGFNGSGKTTTMAKLANKFKQFKPVLAAGDTFRAASIEQLEVHGKNLGLDVVKHRYGADSAAVIFDAKKHAKAIGSKLVLADTAGRSHSNVNLMDELKKVCRVNNPDMKILVLDALTGNDIYEQSKLFNDAVDVDAIILTKTDVYEKGGAALSATYTIKKPVLYLGTGQGYEDLKEFNPEEIVKNLLE